MPNVTPWRIETYFMSFFLLHFVVNNIRNGYSVLSKKAHRVKAFVYIMKEDRLFGIPSYMYVSTCSQGYTDFGFNQETLAQAYAFSKKETLKQWDIIL